MLPQELRRFLNYRKMKDIDYKKLLEKYMKYVKQEEGTDFIQFRDGNSAASFGITDQEWLQLIYLSLNT